MALVLDATVGGTASNTYITRADANTYFESKFHKDAWDAASDGDKDIVLVEATRLLDAYYIWAQHPTSSTQALQWPRNGVLDTDRWNLIEEDVLPDELKWATCEWAQAILVGDRTADSDVETQGLSRLKAGSVELEFKDSVYAKPVPDVVVNLIPEWWGYVQIQSGAGMRAVPLHRA
jgi:hypothetical protein